jgi:hypothetical protein
MYSIELGCVGGTPQSRSFLPFLWRPRSDRHGHAPQRRCWGHFTAGKQSGGLDQSLVIPVTSYDFLNPRGTERDPGGQRSWLAGVAARRWKTTLMLGNHTAIISLVN